MNDSHAVEVSQLVHDLVVAIALQWQNMPTLNGHLDDNNRSGVGVRGDGISVPRISICVVITTANSLHFANSLFQKFSLDNQRKPLVSR